LEGAKDYLIRVHGLVVTYGADSATPIRAVDGVSLEICPSEVVGILGESGCGKSTLAAALLRLLPPQGTCQGEILFRGRNLLNLSEVELRSIRGREIALIPQDPALSLNPVMTAGSLIGEVLRAHLPLNSGQRRQRVLELLAEVGFDRPEEVFSAYPHQLSGGQRQRIAIAQAVACRPALLIADEPTSKLDASLQTEIIELLLQIRQHHRMAILIISHDPALLAGFADRIAVMYAGRIVELGGSVEILARPLHPYTQALMRIAKSSFITSTRSSLPIPAIAGEPPDPTRIPHGCRFEPRCSERMEVCSHRYPQAFLPEPTRPVNCFKYGE
jgi:oligopeptide/dipeptide ABC transporter ATP-binding protein